MCAAIRAHGLASPRVDAALQAMSADRYAYFRLNVAALSTYALLGLNVDAQRRLEPMPALFVVSLSQRHTAQQQQQHVDAISFKVPARSPKDSRHYLKRILMKQNLLAGTLLERLELISDAGEWMAEWREDVTHAAVCSRLFVRIEKFLS